MAAEGNIPFDMFYSISTGYKFKISDFISTTFLPFETKMLITVNFMNQGAYNRLDLASSLKGYQLILAHPERYLYWENSLHTFEELKTFNLHFQLNTLSLLGYYGNDVKKLAIQLLNLEFYDFFGTDTHKIEQIDYHTKKALELNNKQILILENIINANKEFSIF